MALVRMMLLVAAALLVPDAAAGDAPAPPKQAPEREAETLIPPSSGSGGWGAPVVQLSTVRDRAALFVGGRGGWLLDGRFTIGGGAFGLVNDIPAPPEVQRAGVPPLDLEMGYGGLWLEYTSSPLRLVHVSYGLLVGGGGLSLVFRDGGSDGSQSHAFFVAEPAVVVELNVAKFMRLDVGAAYRAVAGANMEGLSYSDVSGFSLLLAVKFGKF